MENGRWKMEDVESRINNFQLTINNKIRNPKFEIRNYFLFFVLICLMAFSFTRVVYSQSVDSLINEALQNNPQLKALEFRIKSAEYRSESVGYLPPPTIGLEFTQVPFNEPNPFKDAISQNLSISQMFMLGGKLSAMNEAERKNITIAEKEYDSYKLKLISDIKSKYYEIWMIEHHSELRDEIIELLQNLLQSTEQLYTIGKTKYSDVLMIKAELASNKTQNMVFENETSSAIYQMNSLLGRDLDNDELTVFHSWQIDSLKYTAQELAEMLIYSNPDLQRMNSMIEMNKLEITANNKELIPDLMLQGMVMRMPQGMFLTTKTPMEMIDGMGETEYMYSVMASITLPFAPWSAGKYYDKEEELNASISGLSSEKNNMQRRMISELKVMIEKLESAKMQIKLYSNEVIPLYKQTLDAQLIEFQNSRVSINDLINTMQMLLMKEEEMAESKMQHQMLLAEIQAMVGIK